VGWVLAGVVVLTLARWRARLAAAPTRPPRPFATPLLPATGGPLGLLLELRLLPDAAEAAKLAEVGLRAVLGLVQLAHGAAHVGQLEALHSETEGGSRRCFAGASAGCWPQACCWQAQLCHPYP